MNTVTVKINGMEYNLKGKENEEYLLDLAGYVDGKVREIMSNNRKLSSTAVAVLAGLNIADELFKSDEEAENLIKKRNSLEERHLTLRERIKELREEMEKSANIKAEEINILRNTIKAMEEKVLEVNELREKVKSLTSELKEIDVLKTEVESLKGQTIYYKEQLNLKEIECEEYKENAINLSKKITEVKETMNKEYSNLQRENSILNSKNNDLKIEVKESKSKIEVLEELKNKFIRDKEILSKEILDKEKDKEDLRKELLLKEKDRESLRKELLIKEIDKEKLKKELLLKENEKENLIRELLLKEKEIREAVSNEENEKHKKDIENYKKDIENYKLEIEKYKEEIENLRQQIVIMENDLKANIKFKENLKNRSKEMTFKVQNYKFKVLDLEKKLLDAQIELAKQKKFNSSFLK